MSRARISYTDTDNVTTTWTVTRDYATGARHPLSVYVTQSQTIDNPFDPNGAHHRTTTRDVPVVDGEPQWHIQPPAWLHEAAVAIIGGAK